MALRKLCRLAQVSRAGLYRWRKPATRMADPDRAVRDAIQRIALEFPCCSASGLTSLAVGDRVTVELDIPVARQRIWIDAVVRRGGEVCALEFVSLNDEPRNLIKRYCRMQPEEKRRG